MKKWRKAKEYHTKLTYITTAQTWTFTNVFPNLNNLLDILSIPVPLGKYLPTHLYLQQWKIGKIPRTLHVPQYIRDAIRVNFNNFFSEIILNFATFKLNLLFYVPEIFYVHVYCTFLYRPIFIQVHCTVQFAIENMAQRLVLSW